MWIDTDDVEDWTRTPSEMYTYTYYDKRKRQLLVVDHYDYGDMPIAQITIYQSANRLTAKMGVRNRLRRVFFKIHDLRDPMAYIEFWSHKVEERRANAVSNYKIGQEQKLRKK